MDEPAGASTPILMHVDPHPDSDGVVNTFSLANPLDFGICTWKLDCASAETGRVFESAAPRAGEPLGTIAPWETVDSSFASSELSPADRSCRLNGVAVHSVVHRAA
ncbi:MAG: hypothetical protein AAF715_14315 [Myxococcota bacterium]